MEDKAGEQTPRRAQLEQEFLNEMRMRLIRHETNIWACIFRISKSDKQIQFEELDLHPEAASNGKSRRFSEMTPKRHHTFHPFKLETQPRKKSSGDAEISAKLEENLKHKHPKSPRLYKSFTPSQIIDEETSQLNEGKSDISANIVTRRPRVNTAVRAAEESKKSETDSFRSDMEEDEYDPLN